MPPKKVKATATPAARRGDELDHHNGDSGLTGEAGSLEGTLVEPAHQLPSTSGTLTIQTPGGGAALTQGPAPWPTPTRPRAETES